MLASIAKLAQQFRSVIVAIAFYRTYLSIELESSAFNTHITCIIFNIHAIISFLIVRHYRDIKAIIKFSLSLGDRQRIIFNAKFASSVKTRKTLCVTILKKTFNLSALNFFFSKKRKKGFDLAVKKNMHDIIINDDDGWISCFFSCTIPHTHVVTLAFSASRALNFMVTIHFLNFLDSLLLKCE